MTYRVELKEHLYAGGYTSQEWTIVDTFGKDVKKDGITLRFDTEEAATTYIKEHL